MNSDRLSEIHQKHLGKVSDKWQRYLDEYERIFASKKLDRINILEIGVQNGGSLEVWSQFFPNANCIIGCDVDIKCRLLEYEDPRIQVVVGDILSEETQKNIQSLKKSFDIIMDDGSHLSNEIIKSFLALFPTLNFDGIYIVEDLHCSYWQEFDGGLYKSNSAIGFFKQLVDVINREHWGFELKTEDFLSEFSEILDGTQLTQIIGEINSIEFVNSMCFIKKSEKRKAGLGNRKIVGLTALVNREISKSEFFIPSQSESVWSIPPRKKYLENESNLQEGLRITDEENKKLINTIAKSEEENKKLTQSYAETLAEVTQLRIQIERIVNSKGWRLLQPLRKMTETSRKMKISKLQGKALLFWVFRIPKILKFIVYSNPSRFIEFFFTNKDSNITKVDTREENNRSAVVYLARGNTENEIDAIQNFSQSYADFSSGSYLDFYVLIKGCTSEKNLTDIKISFSKIKHTVIYLDDDGYDIMAYIRASKIIENERVFFMNTFSRIESENWLLKIENAFKREGVGLIGCTGSFDSLNVLEPHFPLFPNPHIRTNAFMVLREDFLDVTSDLELDSKWDALNFESGHESLTRKIENLGKKCLVVGKNGQAYEKNSWPSSLTFRLPSQRNILVSDNQTQAFEQLSILRKILWAFAAWGNK